MNKADISHQPSAISYQLSAVSGLLFFSGVFRYRSNGPQATRCRTEAYSLPDDGLWTHHASRIAFIVVIIVALFWRVFFLDETFVDAATLNNQLPWGYYAGLHSDHSYNRRDLTDTYITRDYFVVAAYREGELPLWNPYTMAGHPIYADGVTRLFSPFLLFYTFLDVPLGYSVARITELMFAAIFMYIFLIGIGVRPNGGLMGAIVFALSSHSLLHVTGLGWWGGLMWLPLILLFADRAIKRNSFASALGAGVFFGLQFYCGWLQNQIYYAGAIILYYLFFAFRQKRGRLLAMMGVTLAVGFALAATQWVPVMELLSHSNRRIVPTELGYIYLPPWYLGTLVFPNLFGTADDVRALRLFTALNVSHDHILYLGIASLLPLGFILYRLKRSVRDEARERIIFFAWMAALALFIMMAAPLYVHVTKFIPVLQVIRVIVRAWVLFIFAAAALVAFGTDWLLKAESDSLAGFLRHARRFLTGAVALVLIAVIASYALRLTGFAEYTSESGRIAFLRKSAAVLSDQFTPPGLGILIPLLLLFAVFFLVRRMASAKMSRKAFYMALVALLVADLFWQSAQFNPTFDRSGIFPPTKITSLLQSLPPGRVLIVPSDIETNRSLEDERNREKIIAPPNTLLPYRISTVTGKNQQFPKWFREFASLVEPQPYLSHVVFEQAGSRYFDLLNVRYLLTHASRPAPDGYDLIASEEGISVYENKSALPRAFFVDHIIEVPTHADAVSALSNPDLDIKTTAVVETGSGGAGETRRRGERIRRVAASPTRRVGDSQGSRGAEEQKSRSRKAEIIEDHRNRVVISTDNESDGLLILSDNYYPGWQATVDDKPVEILRANVTMRAVRVAGGKSVVSFRFAPDTFRVSVYVSLTTAGLVLVVLVFAAIRKKWKSAVSRQPSAVSRQSES
ncbi:MAG: YfhO family protein [Blastocatellia bacterium]|nr:YfhO family protein [Blastocatellia bacterium]